MAKKDQSNKTVVAAVQTEAAPAAVVVSKSSKATPILAEMFGRAQIPARKDMIKRLQESDVGLTAKGAATYLQNFKKKNGLVRAQVPAAA